MQYDFCDQCAGTDFENSRTAAIRLLPPLRQLQLAPNVNDQVQQSKPLFPMCRRWRGSQKRNMKLSGRPEAQPACGQKRTDWNPAKQGMR